MQTALSIAMDALAYGMALFIICIGLSLTMGLMRVVNLAHGAFAMIGGYIASYAARDLGLGYALGIILAMIGTVIIAVPLERLLYRRIYDRSELSQVLMELSQRAGVDFDVQPGAIQAVPAEFRTVRLMFDNVSIKQALDSLAGFTGLAWTANDKGVYIWSQQTQATTTARDPIVGMVQLSNGMQLLLPKSQIPPDVQEYLQKKTDMEIAKIRQMMQEEGFKPTTRPTTAPADERL